MHLIHRWSAWSPPFLDADTNLVQSRHCRGCGKVQLRDIVTMRSPYSPAPARPHWTAR